MIKMYNYWKNSYSDTDLIDSEKIKKLKNNSEFRWPIGISNSFDYYMTYLPNRGGGYETTHQKYWDTYIQKCWDESELIHLEYKNDPKAFRANFIKTNLKQDPKLSIKKRLFNFNKKPLSPKKTKVWLYAIHIFFGLFILAELILALPLILIESSLLIGLDTGIHRFPEHLTYIISLLFTLGLFGCPLMYIFSLVRSIQTFKSNENKKAIRYALTPIFPFLFLMLMVLISSI